MGVARILIVEDDFETADYLNLLLSRHGYCVTKIVETGEDAVYAALNSRPDLVLMDIMLRGKIDGIRACDQIKKAANIPVLFVTAYADKCTIEAAMQTNPHGCIFKPFKCAQLINEVEMALAGRAKTS